MIIFKYFLNMIFKKLYLYYYGIFEIKNHKLYI